MTSEDAYQIYGELNDIKGHLSDVVDQMREANRLKQVELLLDIRHDILADGVASEDDSGIPEHHPELLIDAILNEALRPRQKEEV